MIEIPETSARAGWWHLATRFVKALWPFAPGAADVTWAESILTEPEFELWSGQPAHDRRHTIEVARGVEAMLDGTAHAHDTRWPAAALLHDVGKITSHLSVYGRVVATLAGKLTGKRQVDAWSASRGFTRRVGLYFQHGAIGADLIRMAGGRDEAAVWAAAHHDRAAWDALTLPREVVRALVVSDAD